MGEIEKAQQQLNQAQAANINPVNREEIQALQQFIQHQ